MTKYEVTIKDKTSAGIAHCMAESHEDAVWRFGHAPELIGMTVDYDTVQVAGKRNRRKALKGEGR